MLSFFEATCHKSAQGSPYLLWIFFQTCHKDWFPMGFSPGFSHGFPLKQTVTRRDLDALGPLGTARCLHHLIVSSGTTSSTIIFQGQQAACAQQRSICFWGM